MAEMKTVILWDESCRDIEGILDVQNYDERLQEVVTEASKSYYMPDENGLSLWQKEEIELDDHVLQVLRENGYQCEKHPCVFAEV